ncbi:Proline-rich protein 2 [Spatholobus suberectus]|nr:Proline-rich protein 2 [Spatholobus suberectus]
MQNFMERQGALVCFWLLSVFFVVRGFNYGDHRTVEVVGHGECADCRENNIKNSHAFSGLRVTVDCKSAHGHFRTRGASALDEYGNFKVSLPQDMVEDGELKEDCYAQLHSASAEPCPSLGNSKIVTKSMSDDKHTLGPAGGKLRFSLALCTSAFFWHFFKHPHFPFPPKGNDYPPYPPKDKEPKPLPPVPVYKKPPAPVPTYKKPPTTPPPVVKKPCPPKEKTPSPTPVYKPLPPSTPISKPPPTMPPFFKFFPPFPFKKKPCPPLPKMEPPKYFYQHPWFGNWPPSHS